MELNLAVLVKDTGIHRPSVQVDVTRKLVLLGVESPEVPSSVARCCPTPAYHAVCRGGDLNKYQPAAADCLQRPLVPRSRLRARLMRQR